MLFLDRLYKDFIVMDFYWKGFNLLKCFVVEMKLERSFIEEGEYKNSRCDKYKKKKDVVVNRFLIIYYLLLEVYYRLDIVVYRVFILIYRLFIVYY